MALVTGGSPRTVGVFYDVAYDRVLAAPAKTTGNGVAAGQCMSKTPNGTRTEYEEGIDKDQSKLDGGANDSSGGGITSIDKDRLIRDPFNGCKPVYPWNFVRTNTIFGIVHQAGGYTAWSDKHPSYSSVAGPGDGTKCRRLLFAGNQLECRAIARRARLHFGSRPDKYRLLDRQL